MSTAAIPAHPSFNASEESPHPTAGIAARVYAENTCTCSLHDREMGVGAGISPEPFGHRRGIGSWPNSCRMGRSSGLGSRPRTRLCVSWDQLRRRHVQEARSAGTGGVLSTHRGSRREKHQSRFYSSWRCHLASITASTSWLGKVLTSSSYIWPRKEQIPLHHDHFYLSRILRFGRDAERFFRASLICVSVRRSQPDWNLNFFFFFFKYN